jgi:hypothetical protein
VTKTAIGSASAFALLIPFVLAGPAAAVDFDGSFRLVDEIRLGAAAHDPGTRESGTADVVGEVLSKPLWTVTDHGAFFDGLLSPRVHVGASINTARRTDLVYAGLTWHWKLDDRFFVEGLFGGAWNDSPQYSRPHHLAMGCSVTFHEGADLGWRIDDHWSVMAGVVHASHAGLCSDTNPGLTQFETKIGYRF